MQNTISNPANPATIRPGQRHAYHKGTRQQIALRTEAAALLRDCGFTKTQIHRAFQRRYGLQWRQTDRYLHMARTRA